MAGPHLPLCAMTVLPNSSQMPRPKVAMEMKKQMMAMTGVSRVLRLQLGQHDLIACFHLQIGDFQSSTFLGCERLCSGASSTALAASINVSGNFTPLKQTQDAGCGSPSTSHCLYAWHGTCIVPQEHSQMPEDSWLARSAPAIAYGRSVSS